VGGGYYYFDAGYWFPAWGYDPNYEAYDYDGPIFTYGNLLPDQVIVNVQRALQELGYYSGGINGALSAATRQAISAYQQDEGLEVNGVIDEPTVYALGLI
jgi:peptidoglycan hydrolase-like protein with peptidoglycan-binding domain